MLISNQAADANSTVAVEMDAQSPMDANRTPVMDSESIPEQVKLSASRPDLTQALGISIQFI